MRGEEGIGNTVRPEPVEGLSFSFGAGKKEGQGFDKLSPNGCGAEQP
jgi:hypothetical protein